MRTGRPSRGLVERASNLAQVAFLCRLLALDADGLWRFLSQLPSGEGGLIERQARYFVHGKQSASLRRAAALDRHAPGFLEVTEWPWFCLDLSRCQPSMLRRSLIHLHAMGSTSRQLPSNLSSHAEVSVAAWLSARVYFQMLLKFRLCQVQEDQMGMAAVGPDLLSAFSRALCHPAIFGAKHELSLALETAYYSSVLVAFCCIGARSQLLKHRGGQ